MGMGGDELYTVFSGETIKVSSSRSVVNGLVDEFTKVAAQVHNRWPMGLGKYLLNKVEAAMLQKGILQVDKIPDQAGNWVFVNAQACGLSNKLSDFAKLAVRMPTYEASLAKLTAKITVTAPSAPAGPYYVPM